MRELMTNKTRFCTTGLLSAEASIESLCGSIKRLLKCIHTCIIMREVRMKKQPRALNRCVPTLIVYAFRCFRT